MPNLSGIVNSLRRLAGSNPDAVRGGLDKVEGVINSKTGGKYADKLAQGRRGVDSAIGVPSQTRDAYRDGAQEDVRTDPVPPPSPVNRPTSLDDDGSAAR